MNPDYYYADDLDDLDDDVCQVRVWDLPLTPGDDRLGPRPCNQATHARGLCATHYTERLRLGGTP